MSRATKGTILFFLSLALAGIYYGLQPSETVRLKGLEKDVSTDEYSLYIRSHGELTTAGGRKTFFDPPYTFSLRIIPEDEAVQYVELQDILVFGCGTTTHLRTYEQPLIYLMDLHDNKNPIALYELRGEVTCHENIIMDINFNLRNKEQHVVTFANERVLVEAYDYIPSTLGYWWSNVWHW